MHNCLVKQFYIPIWSDITIVLDEKNLYLKTKFGTSFFKLSTFLKYTKVNNILYLNISDSNYLPLLNTAFSILKHKLFDLHFYFTFLVCFKGVNFKFLVSNSFLELDVGKRFPLFFPIPSELHIETFSAFKDYFLIKGIDRTILTKFFSLLSKSVPINKYTGNGIFSADSPLILKIRKKK